MDNNFQANAEKKMSMLESWLAPLFAKFPHLPQSARDAIVQVAPWLSLIFGVLGLFAILSLGGLGMVMSMFGGGTLLLTIAILVGILGSVLDLLAFKPLLARKKKGWNYIFYGTVLSAVSTILHIATGSSGMIGGILGVLIGFWILFEVRGMYSA